MLTATITHRYFKITTERPYPRLKHHAQGLEAAAKWTISTTAFLNMLML